MKVCSVCGEEKDEREFHLYRKDPSKNEHSSERRPFCRDCRAALRRGVRPEQYQQMLAEQNDSCAICRCREGEGFRRGRLSIDHNHTTNKVRGLLCAKCNRALGAFGDDVSLLKAAVTYMENHA